MHPKYKLWDDIYKRMDEIKNKAIVAPDKFDPNKKKLVHGWFSPLHAKYIGFNVYQETDVCKDNEIIWKGQTRMVTHLVESSERLIDNGDEMYEGPIWTDQFVRFEKANYKGDNNDRANKNTRKT